MRSYKEFIDGTFSPSMDEEMTPQQKASRLDMIKKAAANAAAKRQAAAKRAAADAKKAIRRDPDIGKRKEVDEALSPAQKKIDHNKNGKIDGADLAKLRKEEACTCDCGQDPCVECGKSHHDVTESSCGSSRKKMKEEAIEERNKENALKRKTMDAARGARYKLNNPVPDSDHKTAQAKNKAIGRALRNEETDTMEKQEMAKTQLHFVCYAAEEILEFIEAGGEIEEWYQNKLSKLHSDMEGLYSYAKGEEHKMGMDESATPYYKKDSFIKKMSSMAKRERMERERKEKEQQKPKTEQAPVAPAPDKKYIKGTPEHKAYMATKKPRTGMPTNEEVELDEAVGTAAKHAGKTGLMGGKYSSHDHMMTMKNFSKVRDQRAAQRDAEHKKQDPKHAAAGYAKHMVDTNKAKKKAAARGVDSSHLNWKHTNGVKRGKLPEEVDESIASSIGGALGQYAGSKMGLEGPGRAHGEVLGRSIDYHARKLMNKLLGKKQKQMAKEEADDKKPPFDGPYKKNTGTTTDKSGAQHSPMSRARHLARIALQKKKSTTNEGVMTSSDKKVINVKEPNGKMVTKQVAARKVTDKDSEMKEGWDDMLKAAAEKKKPQPNGGQGRKQGTRYGGSKQKDDPVKEQKDGLKDACWKGYEAIGTKKKNGKTVPNCVPVKEGKMSKAEKDKAEDIVKGMKKNVASFKDRYGSRAKDVMYATANKLAQEEKADKVVNGIRFRNEVETPKQAK